MKGRLVSLDAFRGITIAGMILVNNPGSWSHVYAPLLHARWHGWTPTDFIFPFFLFIVGVSMVFSFDKQLGKNNKRAVTIKMFRRALTLVALGLLLNFIPKMDFSTLRWPGVLQRIGIVYAFASLIYLNFSWKGQAYAATALLVAYWGMMKLIPVPGYGAGDLSTEGNLAAYIDNILLHGHMWKASWDPEGLLSSIPAIATTLTGSLTGRFIKSERDRGETCGWLFVAGWIAIVVGLFWDIVFPINKYIWTSSYVIFTSGAALQFLAFCYFLIDVKGYRTWATPAIIYGVNAIAVFVLSGLLAKLMIYTNITMGDGTDISVKNWIYQQLFASWAGPINGSLLFAISNVVFWLGMMAILYRKKIYIKI